MQSPTAAPAIASRQPRELVSLAAGFAAGLLLGARPRSSSALRALATVGAAALGGLAFAAPSSRAVRKAGIRRSGGTLHFSLIIPRPVEQVFALCADFENFPRIIRSLERVIDYGDGRSKWCARTPAGNTVEWNTVTTKFVTNSVIGWKSIPGSGVRMNGLLRFSPEPSGTCVRIVLDYHVQNATLRDAMAALFAPSNSRKLEREIRGLATRMAEEPEALAKELPPVVNSESVAVR